MDSSVIVQYTILLTQSTTTDHKPLSSLLEDDEVENDQFMMIKTFESVREFIIKAGQIFSIIDSLADLNAKFSQNIESFRI
jgi:hypothetical protein